ncbi:MAG TPA: SagB/ThcOx family dehydrogenase [Candidatus Saccharimonadales bacterium]|nr:SagB/ThcOx family dehydrogenase [Candidatus Saccharimonadales bacterium]
MNDDPRYTIDYHEKTKHSQASVLYSRHYLDWNNRPNPFKVYLDLPSHLLPSSFPIPSMNAISAISSKVDGLDLTPGEKQKQNSRPVSRSDYQYLKLSDLSSILFFSCGITRYVKFDSGSYYMRAASATGALYPIEVYIITTDLHDDKLDAGIYHFNPGEFSLISIRHGDYRKILSSISGNNKSIRNSPISLVFTSNAWRNAWKYQSRSYRHWFWDTGVIVANLLAVSKSMGINTRLIMGFIDDQANRLLGLETHKEASILIAPVGISSLNQNKNVNSESHLLNPQGNSSSSIEPLVHKTYPLSQKENFYPEIWRAYDSSKLVDNKEVALWSKIHRFDKTNNKIEQGKERKWYLLKQPSSKGLKNDLDIGHVILKRGSSRRFSNLSIPLDTLANILINSSELGGNIPIDYKPDHSSLIEFYVLVNSVEGLQSGGYYFNISSQSLDFLKDIPTENFSGHLCLDQSLFANASVVIFLMTDLKIVLDTLGNRGYRAAQLEAGIIAGKIYLLSYALGIGASGSTFYDDEVNDFFCPHDKQKATMIAIGVGVPSYRSKSGSILPVRLSREQILSYNSNTFY